MRKRRDGKMPVALEKVQGKFADWRDQKQGRERIPEELWEAAARVARQHGVNQVSSILRLDYSRLKQLVDKKDKPMDSTQIADVVFAEVEGVSSGREPMCVVELEKGNGVRMRICVRDAAMVDWSRMKEAFLGA